MNSFPGEVNYRVESFVCLSLNVYKTGRERGFPFSFSLIVLLKDEFQDLGFDY